ADDNGDRLASISPVQVKAWVDFANDVYAPAGIQFAFEPRDDGPDWSALRHTAINSMMSNADSDFEQTVAAAQREAGKRPGKVVVFFRHGRGGSPTGGAFSSTHYDFVVGPGFWSSMIPSGQNIEILAHEPGHFLGLDHTHGREFKTVKD